MKKLGSQFGVAACGLATTLLVVFLNSMLEQYANLNLFALSIWFVVPAGAVAAGMLAGSGYYLAGSLLHQRASPALAVQMVIIAPAAQLLSYWLSYQGAVLDDGTRIAGFVPFLAYLKIFLTSATYSVESLEVGKVGALGYVFALLQLAGFVTGALVVYFTLRAKPACDPCNRFYKKIAPKKMRIFGSAFSADGYYAQLPLLSRESAEFASLVASDTGLRKGQGSFIIHTHLMGCPSCGDQVLHDKVESHDGASWKNRDDLERYLHLPAGVDLAPLFR